MYKSKVYEGVIYLVETNQINILTPFLENLRNEYVVLKEDNYKISVRASSKFKAEIPAIQEERLFNWVFKIINLEFKNTLGQISYSFKEADEVKKPPYCSEKGSGLQKYGISNILKIDVEINGKKINPIIYKI